MSPWVKMCLQMCNGVDVFSIPWLLGGTRVSVPAWVLLGDADLCMTCLALLPENRECSDHSGDVIPRGTQTKKRGPMGFPLWACSDGLRGMAVKQPLKWRKLCSLACRWGPWDAPLAGSSLKERVLLWVLFEWSCPGLSGESEQFSDSCPPSGEAGITNVCFLFSYVWIFTASFTQVFRTWGER